MRSLAVSVITVLPFIYMGFIWYLSSQPADAVIETPFPFDDVLKESLHLVEFGLLYWFFVLMLAVQQKLTAKTSMVAALISVLYGLIDEIHQAFVPSRSSTFIDFVKDTIGVAVSFYMMKVWYFQKRNGRFYQFFQLLSRLKG
ncbi:VanZ family protein [Bacillus alveayuensis]|jgi:VanZ family protein|uniref:VanZ family protein n=1 Tax=Aeribacillus alveayuensis TaxID=279215 RepID=A0ABT9VNN4_9BACI|nr:VanZ family protein [Bacillus alveayuensis]MDQ0162598.1 VanZ family protein [Bacillus alveayuensis]